MTEAPFSYGNEPHADFDSQFARVFEAAECRTQMELAKLLDIKQSSVSDAKRRKAVPAEWLVKLFERKRINPDWIRSGTGHKFIQTSFSGENKAPAIMHVVKYRPSRDCTTDELLAELVRRALKKVSAEKG